ncbi:MAG: primosomal protein N' (replication factor Y), partial [Porticoccaceae bacterium]
MADLTPVIVRVAVPSPLRRLFDYLVPAEMVTDAPPSALQPGCRVKVTFGRREVTGLIIECADTSTFALEKLKPVTQLIDVEPLLPASLFRLFIWASRYYQHPIGDALFSTLPTLLRKGALPPEQGQKCWQLSTFGKGLGPDSLKQAPKQRAVIDKLLAEGVVSDEQLVALFSRAVLKPLEEKLLIESSNQCIPEVALDKLLRQDNLTLYPSQKQALEAIDHHHFNCSLLDGVTGSGKTEIYLQSIEKTLRYERQALVLIPEISLTPQTEKRFRDRFHVPIVTLHSGLTDKQRLNAWMQARSGQAKIILGTRSAIFTPLKAPGLIILDEEHDPSYKQQEGFRYSARDLAVIRAQQEHIPIILGSATPSLESLNNCHAGRYQHLVLSTRAGNAVQPDWQVIDLKTERSNAGIAATTLMAIDQTLKNNHQVLVFLNRRGFAPAMLCHQCG